MVKSKLKNGTHILVFRIEHFVKIEDFTKHLAEYFYLKAEEEQYFNQALTKKEAEKILKDGLFFHGLRGELPDDYFHTSFEQGEIFNKIYQDALLFVKTNYPYLDQKTEDNEEQ